VDKPRSLGGGDEVGLEHGVPAGAVVGDV
jgi:hypothetical protein